MTKARSEQIDLSSTSFYHCIVRCVRRAYLCGDDSVTGKNFDHRRQWIVNRCQQLASVFTIDVCAYAVMSNHYHLVLHVNANKAQALNDEEVVALWGKLFKVHFLVDSWLSGKETSPAVEIKAKEIIEEWRSRLMSISWFMRCLNETVARQANAEDGCTGRFWEGRFKSQALLDEAALLTCMAYVDLNPIRAGIADTPETSDFTSLQARLYDYAKRKKSKSASFSTLKRHIAEQAEIDDKHPDPQKLPLRKAKLMRLSGSSQVDMDIALPITREDYFHLVEMTGKVVRDDKRGAIDAQMQNIFHRFGIEESAWIDQVIHYHENFTNCAGSETHIREYAQKQSKQWMKGIGAAKKFYSKQVA